MWPRFNGHPCIALRPAIGTLRSYMYNLMQTKSLLRHGTLIVCHWLRGEISSSSKTLLPLFTGIKFTWNGLINCDHAYANLHRDLDVLYVREHGETTWAPRYGNSIALDQLELQGEIAIIGKGPDLDKLNRNTLSEFDAVICVNQSIHKVERLKTRAPVYSIQSDMRLKDMCKPRQGKLIVTLLAAHFYKKFDEKYVFRLNELDVDRLCTAAFAVELARKAGARRFKMFAFNAVTQDNFEYARCIGGQPADTQSWHRHKAMIEKAAGDVTVDWVLI